MSDTLFNISQYQSEPRPSYNTDWTDATGTDPAWDAPDLNPNLEASTQGADSDAPTGWQSADVFPITLKSGQTINVQFIPSKTGELRMHSFNFTGPISPTGFKSHFVLAILSEEFPHPRDYAQAYVQELITQMEEKPHQVMKTKRPRSVAQAQAPQGQANDNDSFTQETTMANDVAPELSHASVEVVEELSPEEAADQQRLELKVERAFYEAGKSLAELRDRRLYRSICKTFEEYCHIRFGFTYRHGNQLIAGSLVIENLQMGSIRSQNDEAQTGAVRSRILPTKLEQVKPLTTLEPEEQRQVWEEAVREAGGIPSGRRVKGIVERLKEKHLSPATNSYNVGDMFTLKGLSGSERKYNGCWAQAIGVNEFTLKIEVHDATITVNPDNLNRIDSPDERRQLPAIHKRIKHLRKCGLLDRGAYVVLESLGKQTYLTEVEEGLLSWLENHYGVV